MEKKKLFSTIFSMDLVGVILLVIAMLPVVYDFPVVENILIDSGGDASEAEWV